MGGMASTTSSSILLSWTLAPVSVRARGMPCASVRTCRLVPALPRSVGLGPVAEPPLGRHRGAVESSPAEVDGVAPPQAVEEHALEAIPNSGPLPVPQAPPARHTGPTAHPLAAPLPTGRPAPW